MKAHLHAVSGRNVVVAPIKRRPVEENLWSIGANEAQCTISFPRNTGGSYCTYNNNVHIVQGRKICGAVEPTRHSSSLRHFKFKAATLSRQSLLTLYILAKNHFMLKAAASSTSSFWLANFLEYEYIK